MSWCASVWGLCLGVTLCSAAHATPLPIQSFFTPPVSRGAQLSPGGDFLALIEHADGQDRVSVIDLSSHQKTTALKSTDGRPIDWVRWKDDERLVAGLGHDRDSDDDQPRDRVGELLTALDRDGGRPVSLSGQGGAKLRGDAVRIADPLRSDPTHVLVAAADPKGGTSLWKLDVHSGAAEFVSKDADDPDDRLPRGAMVVRYDQKGSSGYADFDVLGPAQDAHTAYVAMQPRSQADGDTASLRIYDFKRRTFSDPVWPALKYDVSDVVYHEGDRALAGVCYTADTYVCDFKDAALNADYRRGSAALHDERSLTPLGMSDDGKVWLFGVSGPNEPGAYYVFDRRTGRMTLAANRQPGLPASRLGTMERFVYAARDGTPIPGYLTRPPKAPRGPLPLIVMPHGGPEARDSYSFDIWAQVFATRGYLVFQPNFRGSSGYGRAFAEAGYRQWGARMQDDLTDGVHNLISSGRADPKRICIFGASYGGYAALYGGAQTPELYKCVASFAGVADLKALVDWEHATKGHEPRWRYAQRAIGDPRKEAARLAAASPIAYAAGYRPPVLLIHGAKDASVPIVQSQMMAKALKKAGKPVKLLVYDDEGHADWNPADEQSALSELAAFFESHIAPASGT